MIIITISQKEELKKASEPLIKWINENCYPHVCVLVDYASAELFEGIARIKNEEFIKD